MLYLFFSFICCAIAVPCFEHGRVITGIIFMIMSCFMPVLKDINDRKPPPPPVIIEPDPAVEARFKSIMDKLDQIEASLARCSELLDVTLQPAQ